MIVEIIHEGVGVKPPLRLKATQILIRQDNGTPICLAAEFAGQAAQVVSKAGDPDFNRVLKLFSINMDVECTILNTPGPPAGSRLLTGPTR